MSLTRATRAFLAASCLSLMLAVPAFAQDKSPAAQSPAVQSPAVQVPSGKVDTKYTATWTYSSAGWAGKAGGLDPVATAGVLGALGSLAIGGSVLLRRRQH